MREWTNTWADGRVLRGGSYLDALAECAPSKRQRATEDLRGNLEVDNPRPGGVTMEVPVVPPGAGGFARLPTGPMTMTMPNATIKNVTGNRLGDGLSLLR